MTNRPRNCAATRPGFTTIELIVTMSVAMILLAGGASVFHALQKSFTRQRAVSDSQTQIHLSAEQLVRLVRNAEAIEPASNSSRLGLSGGLTHMTCGHQTCWIEMESDGRLVARPPASATGNEITIAKAVRTIEISYGIFDENGKLSNFVPLIPSGSADDVLAIRLRLVFSTREGQSTASGTLVVHAARRDKIMDRLSL